MDLEGYWDGAWMSAKSIVFHRLHSLCIFKRDLGITVPGVCDLDEHLPGLWGGMGGKLPSPSWVYDVASPLLLCHPPGESLHCHKLTGREHYKLANTKLPKGDTPS